MSLLDYYKNKIGVTDIEFLSEYYNLMIMERLKHITYLCGMEYASKDIYDFKEPISRFDHSLTVAAMVYRLTKSKSITLAGLFHDIATPCFSHVVDYMNNDFIDQESTEEYTESILKSDSDLLKLLDRDGIDIDDIVNFKKYTVVDYQRPFMCADRIDGIILSGISWSKNINEAKIDSIVDHLKLYLNEFEYAEIGFSSIDAYFDIINVNYSIDMLCSSKEDIYMMMLMANILKDAINRSYIDYHSLYILGEEDLLKILNSIDDNDIKEKLSLFYNMRKEDIPDIDMPKVKERRIKPIIDGVRL